MHYGQYTYGCDPCYNVGYGYPVVAGRCYGYGGFALIVVLFILLIIIGATTYGK